MGYHGWVEFGNRLLISVVGIPAVVAVLLALIERPRSRRRLGWSTALLATIPGQAVVGGIVVRTHLNPWMVAAHFLFSIVVLAIAYQLWRATVEPDGPARPVLGPPLRGLTWLVALVSGAVLVAGTVVTGSGPHAGDEKAKRTGLDPAMVAQLHADLVMLLVGLSVALWFALRAVTAPPAARRAAAVLVWVELAQGAIGFTQYFTHLPVLLVGLHMAGACAVWIATLGALTATRVREAPAPLPDRSTDRELSTVP
jgi:cytochrome c oxidase assembly protein subunit 15